MKVRLRNIEVDSNQEPIKLVFDNDEQRIEVATHLSNMEPKDGPRGYTSFPDQMSIEEVERALQVNSEDTSWKEKYLRTLADFDNFKKRSSKEKEDIRNSTKASMITSILDLDNDLSIAVNQIKDEEAKSGVELILSKLSSFLKSQGIETIQTEKYDPDLHEVISVLETGEQKIIETVSKGYMISGKPFRYPKVILTK
jgi:molecular chaperone GrpE